MGDDRGNFSRFSPFDQGSKKRGNKEQCRWNFKGLGCVWGVQAAVAPGQRKGSPALSLLHRPSRV